MLKIALLDCAINEKCSLFQATWEHKKKTRGWHRGESVPSSLPLSFFLAFALFFRPHPGGFDSSIAPIPRSLPSKAKKMLTPGGQAGGSWAQLELTDA